MTKSRGLVSSTHFDNVLVAQQVSSWQSPKLLRWFGNWLGYFIVAGFSMICCSSFGLSEEACANSPCQELCTLGR